MDQPLTIWEIVKNILSVIFVMALLGFTLYACGVVWEEGETECERDPAQCVAD